MRRREFIQYTTGAIAALMLAGPKKLWSMLQPEPGFSRADFGDDFKWGVATAAYQIEGAWNEDDKGPSIWDDFSQNRPKKIKTRENGNVACDFYHRYDSDVELVKEMNFDVFRFSTSWPRILPEGTGKVNQKGIDFYHKVIDSCLEKGVEPWITLYHWDLPLALQKKGGWANRKVIDWFSEYAEVVTKAYGDKVKNWMVLNEPMAFTAVGHLMGMHAPGKIAPRKFLRTAHHATMVQAAGGRIIRTNVPEAYIGSTFSCSHVAPHNPEKKSHQKAANRMDAMLNRLFIEPLLGMGYPTENFPFLKKIENHVEEGDMEKVQFDFDFIGLQNYTQFVVKSSAIIPFVHANQVKPHQRGVKEEDITEMGWEVYPEGIYKIIKQFTNYENLPPIIITENGAAFKDVVTTQDRIHDKARVAFFKNYLQNILKAKKEGADIRGYFVWTLMDNFEWAEGYKPRFGLVHIDFKSQTRRIKDSGRWFKEFLAE